MSIMFSLFASSHLGEAFGRFVCARSARKAKHDWERNMTSILWVEGWDDVM